MILAERKSVFLFIKYLMSLLRKSSKNGIFNFTTLTILLLSFFSGTTRFVFYFVVYYFLADRLNAVYLQVQDIRKNN